MQPEGSVQHQFTTTAEEIKHLSLEAQRENVLQHQPHKNLESAALHSVQNYARAEAKDFLHDTHAVPAHEIEKIVLKLKPEQHDQTMEELFAIMLEKGVKNALDIARKMNSPHVEDDFHRFLVQYLHTIGALPGVDKKAELFKELDHSLFMVSLPAPDEGKDSGAQFKSFIQAMKQFYLGMQSVGDYYKEKQYYTLELAVANSGSGIGLYASIPRTSIDIFEKMVHAYYPDAMIDEMIDDYNIFDTTGGGISASVAKLKEFDIFPIATDETFEHDPLTALISSLTQFEQTGEGAAIQIMICNDQRGAYKLYDSAIKASEKTHTPVKKVYDEMTESIFKSAGKGLLSIFDTSEKKDDEKKDIPSASALGIELAQTKNKTQVLSASIRIVTSATSLARSQTLLATIKSSFHQFSRPGSNSIEWKDVKTSHIPEFCRDFSFRTLHTDELLSLNIDELATLFHFPVGLTSAPELKESNAATAPAPSTMNATTPSGVMIGTNNYRGKETPVYFAKEDRVRHCYVIGQTGTGKTVFLKNMIIQDIKNGDGVCFIDPHGNDIEDILANIPPERIDDVIYFDPAYTARPMGLNMLEYDIRFPEQKIFVINELLAIFNKLFDMKVAGGPMFEQYFRNSAGLVMEDPESGCTLLEISRVLTDKAFRDMKLSKCKNPIIAQFWENAEKTTGEAALANFVPYITNKFDVFVSNDIMRPVIAQQKSVLNFRDIMDQKKILLVNLSKGRLGDINSHLIGLLLVGKITMAALSRVDIVGKGVVNDFYLYIDEFQNVTTDSIATILSEARKYRLSLTVAHQYIEQLEDSIRDAVFGNVGSMVVHRVSPENAEVFAKQFAPEFTPADIIKQQNLNCYVKMLVGGVPVKPFNSHTPFPPRGDSVLGDKVKELSYLKYGRPRAEVEEEIMARYRK